MKLGVMLSGVLDFKLIGLYEVVVMSGNLC